MKGTDDKDAIIRIRRDLHLIFIKKIIEKEMITRTRAVPKSGSFKIKALGTMVRINGLHRSLNRYSVNSPWSVKYFAKPMTMAIFANSDGWKATPPTVNHLCDPEYTLPIKSTRTSKIKDNIYMGYANLSRT